MGEESETGTYLVVVKTSDRFDAGTDANVFILLEGSDGIKSQEIPLTESLNHGANNFRRKKRDLFQIRAPITPSGLSAIKIRHDNTGENPSWHLEIVQVYDTQKNTVYDFPCGRWLAMDEEDGLTKATLFCQQSREGPPALLSSSETHHNYGNIPLNQISHIIPRQETKVMMWPGYGGYGGYGGYPYGYGGYGGYGYGGYPYGYGGYGGYGYGYPMMGPGMMGAGMMWGMGRHSWSWSW